MFNKRTSQINCFMGVENKTVVGSHQRILETTLSIKILIGVHYQSVVTL